MLSIDVTNIVLEKVLHTNLKLTYSPQCIPNPNSYVRYLQPNKIPILVTPVWRCKFHFWGGLSLRWERAETLVAFNHNHLNDNFVS